MDYLRVHVLSTRGRGGTTIPWSAVAQGLEHDSQSENPGSNPVLCVRAMDTFIHCTFIHVHSLYVVHVNSARLSD